MPVPEGRQRTADLPARRSRRLSRRRLWEPVTCVRSDDALEDCYDGLPRKGYEDRPQNP